MFDIFSSLSKNLGLRRRRKPETHTSPDPSWTIGIIDLMLAFESLGDNCEFGFLQRRCGAEPLGLLRMAASRLSTVSSLVGDERNGALDVDDLELTPHPFHSDSLVVRSRFYDDLDHQSAMRNPGAISADDYRAQAKRLAYLRKRLLNDLGSAEKIFVRRGRDSRPETIAPFLSIFRQRSEAWLLLVVEEPDQNRRGTVERAGERLIVGYIDRIAISGNVLDSEVETWVELLLGAYGMVHGPRDGAAAPTLTLNRRLSLPYREYFAHCEARQEQRSHGDVSVVTIRLTEAVTFDQAAYAIAFEDVPDDVGTLLCSVLINIPSSFDGTYLRLLTISAVRQTDRQADLRKRDVWQRIWVVGHLRAGQKEFVVGLRTDASEGAVLEVAYPVLERGTYPNPVDAGASLFGLR